jgi:hypothetical protein
VPPGDRHLVPETELPINRNLRAPFPHWILIVVPLAIALVVAGAVVSGAQDTVPSVARDDLASIVLRAGEAPGSTHFVGMTTDSTSFDWAIAGIRGAAVSVFTDRVDDTMDMAWYPDTLVVSSHAYWMVDAAIAQGLVDGWWSLYSWSATERQHGTDGSWLVFDPDYDQAGASSAKVPTAAAAWRYGNVVFLVRVQGGTTPQQALDLARDMESRMGLPAESAGDDTGEDADG